MIVIIARLTTKPGQRDKVVEAARPCVDATRKEEGCISYELLKSTENENELVFVERWSGRETGVDAHQKAAHLQAFKEARAPYVEGPSQLTILEATVAQ
jgi:quinol monooxygenase YgiN